MTFRLICGGCGASPSGPLPFVCPNRGEGDVDHVLRREGLPAKVSLGADANPFVRYRALAFSYDYALSRGISDDEYLDIVRALDDSVARVDGRGFRVTPLAERDGLLIKDETGNVSGSHKGRHLFGIALMLAVAERVATRESGHPGREAALAIASCGNAALAAAVVARAAERRLQVFVPVSADVKVVAQLRDLGARVTVCPRRPGVAGDPSYLAFREAVASGAVPFSCQGGDNGLTLDGGRTLGYELAQQLDGRPLERIFLQVGGGALASATVAALRESVELGWLKRMPALFPVQTRGGFPLRRAWERLQSIGGSTEERLQHAATHRSQFMWPWEDEPKSIAHGILDDETYDWLAIVRALFEHGGEPLVVDEATLEAANRQGRALGFNVDATGSSGLAGALAIGLRPGDGVIFSGALQRSFM
jgi:threonine synthase